jgi:hypothetical protein
VNESVPVSSVLDLRINHDRFGTSSDPSLNGNLHYPNNIDRSLNEDTESGNIWKYHADYYNNPSQSQTHPSHSQTSHLLTSSLSLGVPVPRATQCM